MSASLDNASYALFGTRKKNGSIVQTPVWFANEGEDYYVFSAGNAGKVKRLRNFSEVQLAPCTVTGKSLGEASHGDAVLISDPEHVKHAHQQLIKKYGWQMRSLDLMSRLSGKYHQRVFIKIII